MTTWAQQRDHVACFQDPPGVPLYTQVGIKLRGGVQLPVYRCARGSTSLESFHLHINRFIPGESASSANFQAYLLEGIARWNEDRKAAALAQTTKLSCYSHDLQRALSDAATGIQTNPDTDLPPLMPYTGELIGIEYLFSQTGMPIDHFSMSGDRESLSPGAWDEDVEVESEETDLTVPPPPPLRNDASSPLINSSPPHLMSEEPETLPPRPDRDPEEPHDILPSSSQPGAHKTELENPHQDEYMGPDGRGGYERVMALARYLVSLRGADTLSNRQVDSLVHLHNNLVDFDKTRICYPARHRAKLASGRFGSSKTTVVPGAESVKRGFLGVESCAAQWPDVSRLVEAIVTLLLELHPSGQRQPGTRRMTSRWAAVMASYRHIRELVVGNAVLMQRANFQLFEINQHTLSQWYNQKKKQQEVEVLIQGAPLPAHLIGGKICPTRTGPPFPEPSAAQPTHRQTPEIKTGVAWPRDRAQQPDLEPPHQSLMTTHTGELVTYPFLPVGLSVIHTPPTMPVPPPYMASLPPQVFEAAKSRTQKRCRVKEEERSYKRTKQFNTCSLCGQPKLKEFGHRGYKGYSFCPSKESYPVFFTRVTKLIAEKEKKK